MDFGSPLLRAWNNIRPPSGTLAVRGPAPETTETHEDRDWANGLEDSEGADNVEEIQPDARVGTKSKRRLQCVSTKGQRVKVMNWMQQEVDRRGHEKLITSEAVRHFPEIFRGCTYQANIQKCGRWWKNRVAMFAAFKKDHMSLNNSYNLMRKRQELKAGPGRGRKPSDWCNWLYPLIREEFDKLRRCGVKFSNSVLLLMAKNVFQENPHLDFTPSTILADSEFCLMDRITIRWIQQFCDKQNIVPRIQSGKLQVSEKKTRFIERETAYHLGELHRGFTSGELIEDLMENMDETHFIVNMDNKRTLGIRGDVEVRYADVVSGGLGITMVVKCTGGVHGRIGIAFMIFVNPACSYPIRGTPDNVTGVTYRTSRKSFMTSRLLAEYYRERRVNWADPSGRSKVQYVDNCPGHNLIPECLQALDHIKTEVRYFPCNSTHLTQPCDSFVISKIKDAWRSRWDAKKMDMIKAGMWQGDGGKGTSGALKNPGWTYFLKLAADCVRDVNSQVDKENGMSYARLAMIRCGMSLNSSGQWTEEMLTLELQEIIKKYRENFEGRRDGLPELETGSIVPVSNGRTVAAGTSEDLEEGEAPDDNAAMDSGDGGSIFQDAQGPDSVDPDAIEGLTLDSQLWSYLDSHYKA